MEESNGRRQTHDFMNVNVESFSQLPFIRRAPAKEKGAIRLFGKDFGAAEDIQEEDSESSDNNSNKNSKKNDDNNLSKDNNSSSSNRRFECHYCFRNFPTSQALGGHQNAHKRERQNTNRGGPTYLQHHHHQSDSTHYYGFHHHHHNYSHNHYRSYLSAPSVRFYGGQTSPFYSRSSSTTTSTPPTINGNPLGLWRVPPSPNAVRGVYTAFGASDTSSTRSTLPLLGTDHEANMAATATSPQSLTYWYGLKGNVQDHVSLDLHL